MYNHILVFLIRSSLIMISAWNNTFHNKEKEAE